MSYWVSIDSANCPEGRHVCFAEIIFYFRYDGVFYAFLRKFPCLKRTLADVLHSKLPDLLASRLHKFYGFFTSKTYSYKIIPVSLVRNKVVRLNWNETDVFVYTDVPFDWEHE